MAEFYVVGGAVRDELLGRVPGDRDWVAVGATPEELEAAGYRPVGRDFPVFLHPQTGEEVALARTERKSGRGYRGFVVHTSPEVTLEQDLTRRDLTINAMARSADGRLIDPHGGAEDLRRRVLRHVSAAFVEDPVRLLRVARFAARFGDFAIAGETMALMRRMVDDGEVDALVPERVWQEIARGLMEAQPQRLLQVLHDTGALARLLPGLSAAPPLPARLQACAGLDAPLPVRWACLCLGMGDAGQAAAASERLRAPTECRELAELTARERAAVHASAALDSAGLLALIERCDAVRRPERFRALLLACECDHRARTDPDGGPYAPRQRLDQALQAVLATDTAAAAAQALQQGLRGPAVGQRVHAARLAALDQAGLAGGSTGMGLPVR
ncbi:MAG: multifunctional CCA tRNA nucleotidyl transferase/2'3'-cyclic phosphodiesterase/2'nucleotidase/phosphatase [Rubrivivax sp.]|nr:multifunctional CCA tRNA nucleotidyl transferase/2'3'-cyclic phosphodiesterase/2'nucleotidase/phosphatase [Rubrivivax sp.]